MMRYLRGSLLVELSGASPERCLNRWTQAEIAFWDYRRQEALCSRCKIFRSDLAAARREAARAQTTLRVLAERGFPTLLRRLRRRPVLVGGTLLSVALAIFLQSFVWFFRVRGNETVPDAVILHALQEEGVRFGTVGMSINSEDLKNRLLSRIPELRWLAVNREGGLVTVLTAERKPEVKPEETAGICNVIAARPGIIRRLEVADGVAMVAPGDSVETGSLLISGIAEWTTHIQFMRAAGEVYADTARQIETICPAELLQKRYTGRVERCQTVIFQRKREKISGNSSIFGAMCDRMVQTRVWTLPGGYELPLCLETQWLREYELVPVKLEADEALRRLTAETNRLIEMQLVAGTIQRASTQFVTKENSFRMQGTFNCCELISRAVPAEEYEEESIDGEKH